jgi:hypothetical protein
MPTRGRRISRRMFLCYRVVDFVTGTAAEDSRATIDTTIAPSISGRWTSAPTIQAVFFFAVRVVGGLGKASTGGRGSAWSLDSLAGREHMKLLVVAAEQDSLLNSSIVHLMIRAVSVADECSPSMLVRARSQGAKESVARIRFCVTGAFGSCAACTSVDDRCCNVVEIKLWPGSQAHWRLLGKRRYAVWILARTRANLGKPWLFAQGYTRLTQALGPGN